MAGKEFFFFHKEIKHAINGCLFQKNLSLQTIFYPPSILVNAPPYLEAKNWN